MMTMLRPARVALFLVGLAALASVPPARAQCDGTPPALTNFSFTPSSVNTTSASQTVTCNMTLTDDLSGVATATCSFTAPDFVHTASCTASAPASGTRLSGVWTCAVTFPRYEVAGVWTAGVSATDAVGNTADMDLSLFPNEVVVTSDPDTVAPALGAFTLVPTSVNVSAASQNVTCNMPLTDAKSGVAVASCSLSAPNSSQTITCGSAAPSSGTRNNGTFSCTLTVPRYADAGTWVPQVFAADQVGNLPQPPFTPAATLTVTSSPEDIVAPSLTNFSFLPTTISTGSVPQNVTCTMVVADATAGVASATCTFSITVFFPEFTTQTQSCTATSPTSGTRNSGTFQCTVAVPRYSIDGLWTSSVSLSDLAGNQAQLPQAASLNVICASAEAETTCRPAADHQTLTWDPVAGATQYNVYRGAIAGLVDTNADGVPDGGFGTCQNSRDGNLTDLQFVDADVPSGGQGYFYLVAYKSGGVQKGLGTTGTGTPRTVVSSCP